MAQTAAERQRARRQRLRTAEATRRAAIPLEDCFLAEFRGWPIRRRAPSGAWARELARAHHITEQTVRRQRHSVGHEMAVDIFGSEFLAYIEARYDGRPMGQPQFRKRKADQSIEDYLAERWPTKRYQQILWSRIADELAADWCDRRASNAGVRAVMAQLWLDLARPYLRETTGTQLIEALDREGAAKFEKDGLQYVR